MHFLGLSFVAIFLGGLMFPSASFAKPSSFQVCELLRGFSADAIQFKEGGASKEHALLSYFVFGAGVETFSMLNAEASLSPKDRTDWKFMISLGLIGITNAAYAPNAVKGMDYEAEALASCMTNIQSWLDASQAP